MNEPAQPANTPDAAPANASNSPRPTVPDAALRRARRRSITALVLVLLLAATAAVLLWDLEMDLVQLLTDARQTPALLISSGVSYALLLALPFMPGIELGLLMMLVFGKVGALVAYLATLAGLNLAFGAGVYLRGHCLQLPILRRWREQARHFDDQRDAALAGHRLTHRAAGWLRNRGGPADYVLLGLLLNVPGNFLLGGGGGIALLAGLSGRLGWPGFVLTVALATCVVPLLAATGAIDLREWLIYLTD
ncbi:MAG: hypothetical protein AAGB27_13130 [Pseudomonadota bacterium]